MAGHQRIRKQSDPIGSTHFPQMFQQNFKILRCSEVKLTIVAASHNVHRPTGRIHARGTGHGNLKDRPNHTISLTI